MKPLEIVIFVLLIGSLGFTFLNGGKCVLCSLFNKNTSETINGSKQEISNNPTLDLNESNFDSEVLKSNIPVVVDFYAHWCGPCKKLSPIIDELSNEYSGKIKFGKLDVDDNENLVSKYEINSIPHLIIFDKGKIVEHIIGLHSKTEISNNLKKVLE